MSFPSGFTLLLLEFGGNASKAIKAGVNAAKPGVSVGQLAAIVLAETKGWEPKLGGKAILTPSLKTELAQALAHLAHNIVAADAGRPLV